LRFFEKALSFLPCKRSCFYRNRAPISAPESGGTPKVLILNKHFWQSCAFPKDAISLRTPQTPMTFLKKIKNHFGLLNNFFQKMKKSRLYFF